jgi:uncharacterized protein (DUF1501 family)
MHRAKGSSDRITRRAALRAAAALAGVGIASRLGLPSIARAAEAAGSQRRFIFCYFVGGWDQLLFLDPRDPKADGGRYADANRAATLTEPRYGEMDQKGFSSQVIRAGNLTFGPATEIPKQTGARLSKHADRIAIVRGMNMGTLGHVAGMRYFLTGRFPAGAIARGSSIATECAALGGSRLSIPVLSLSVESYNDGYPGLYSSMRVDSVDDLLLVLDRGKELLEKDPVEEALTEFARRPTGCSIDVYDRTGTLSQMRVADDGARATLASRLVDRFRFATGKDAESAAIRSRYGVTMGDTTSVGARAALAAEAVKQGVAQCVSLAFASYLDTHFFGNLFHAQGLHPSIAALSALIDDLATSEAPEELQKLGGKTWLDHTTILAFSEFARTPLFNDHGGRDHHLASSCLLAGAGIAGNKVVGATGEVGMAACRYDYKAGQMVPAGGDAIMPDNIRATLLASAGLPTEAPGVHALPVRELLAKPG